MDMMSSIQECAGRVLNEIARSEKVNILSIASHLGERSLIVYQSIGWLAREGRIRYLQEGSQVYVAAEVPGAPPSQENPPAP
ncbi:MAG: winged helix-turn-helix domain-containing protein [Spirochaetia bacterium]|jgi:hypothetical protein